MARVIRARTEVTPAPVVSARDEARAIVARARQESEAMLQRARDEVAALHGEASAKGLAEGRAAAAALETRAAEARARAIADAESTVVGLVTKIAERVLHERLDEVPERIVSAVRGALDRVRRAKNVELRVHPSDAEVLTRALSRGAMLEPSGVRVIADASLTRGGCVVTSELGTLDARLEVQLSAFERALREGA